MYSELSNGVKLYIHKYNNKCYLMKGYEASLSVDDILNNTLTFYECNIPLRMKLIDGQYRLVDEYNNTHPVALYVHTKGAYRIIPGVFYIYREDRRAQCFRIVIVFMNMLMVVGIIVLISLSKYIFYNRQC